MALGGGIFTTQNKKLPGTYINFVSLAGASAALSGRGICTMPLELDWGAEDEVFEITNEDFQKNSMKILGYPVDHEKMKGMRDLFLNARTLLAYRVNGGGKRAENTFALARYSGTRGNDIRIVIQANVDDSVLYDVCTYMGNTLVDSQTVAAAGELKENEYVSFKPEATLEATASTPLAGGTNGTVDGAAHQRYLDKIESYSYNTMGIVITDETIKRLYVAFNKRLRDERGIKFQLVLYRTAADYMGVINVKNKIEDVAGVWSEASLVYWVTGLECGCEVNKSCQNRKYDGSFTVNVEYTQIQLEQCIDNGEFVLHRVNSEIRVLEDINSMVTLTDTEGDIFRDNQTIRVIDQLGNDIAVLFSTKYLGVIPNDAAGRVSLWSDIVAYHRKLEKLHAIEDFSESDVTVEQGESKKSVVVSNSVTVVNAMSKVYMTVAVS